MKKTSSFFNWRLTGALVGTLFFASLPMVALARTVVITPADTLPAGTVGVAYSQTLTANSSIPPNTWYFVSGSRPPGVDITSEGVISGTPTMAGTYTFTIGVDDSTLYHALMTYTVVINPAPVTILIAPTSFPNATKATAYSMTVYASGGTAPYTWYFISGTRPPGLDISSGGVFSGVPSSDGTYTFTLGVDDSAGHHAMQTYTVRVNLAVFITPGLLASGTVGTAYAQTLTASPATAPITWTVISGSLPAGLSLNAASGLLSGTPSSAGTYNFRVQAVDTYNATGYIDYMMTIAAGSSVTVSIGPSSLPSVVQGTGYYQTLSASGGTAPYSWILANGALPAGLSLSGVGVISGTPTVAGTSSFRVRAYDSAGHYADKDYSITVNAVGSTFMISTTSITNGTVGNSYSATVSATGGSPIGGAGGYYTWSVYSGSLPSGLTLNSNGTITGTPTVNGYFTFSIRAGDSTGAYAYQTYSVTINPRSGSNPLLDNLTRIGLVVHNLVKMPDDGKAWTQDDSAVYYIGTDGKRHAFPNDKVFSSWYTNFSGVRIISGNDMASIPLGYNVTYRPGNRMVKFTTDNKVYAVDRSGVLRWVKTGDVAQALYGIYWNKRIDDVADTFYTNYTFGADVNSYSDFVPATVENSVTWVSDSLRM